MDPIPQTQATQNNAAKALVAVKSESELINELNTVRDLVNYAREVFGYIENHVDPLRQKVDAKESTPLESAITWNPIHDTGASQVIRDIEDLLQSHINKMQLVNKETRA